mgnify:CR=1 FL=1
MFFSCKFIHFIAKNFYSFFLVKHLFFDKNTGEIIEAKSQLSLDEDKIAEEEKLDGYYLFDYYDAVLKDIGRVTNIDFSLKNRNLQEIKKF